MGIAVGWFFLILLAFRLAEAGVEIWRRQNEELSQVEEKLKRLYGWLNAEEQVRSRREEIVGPFSKANPEDLGWMVLQGFQDTAKAKEVSVAELRPSPIAGQGKQSPGLRIDARIEGRLEQITRFLQRLPEAIPGIRLDSLQLSPLSESQQAQGAVRLEFLFPRGTSLE